MESRELSTSEKQALAFLAHYVFENFFNTQWAVAINFSGVDFNWDKHERLTKAQFFGDPDYESAIQWALQDIYKESKEGLTFVLTYIFGSEIPDSILLRNALIMLNIIKGEEERMSLRYDPSLIANRFIEVESYPDEFYRELIELINNLYNSEFFIPIPILIRKLFENLIIDILRYFYGMREINLFYDTNRRRFHDFSKLIENASQKIDDFEWCKDTFNKDILKNLNKYRLQGNSSAHTLTMTTNKEHLNNDKEEINHITKCLFKTIRLIITSRSR